MNFKSIHLIWKIIFVIIIDNVNAQSPNPWTSVVSKDGLTFSGRCPSSRNPLGMKIKNPDTPVRITVYEPRGCYMNLEISKQVDHIKFWKQACIQSNKSIHEIFIEKRLVNPFLTDPNGQPTKFLIELDCTDNSRPKTTLKMAELKNTQVQLTRPVILIFVNDFSPTIYEISELTVDGQPHNLKDPLNLGKKLTFKMPINTNKHVQIYGPNLFIQNCFVIDYSQRRNPIVLRKNYCPTNKAKLIDFKLESIHNSTTPNDYYIKFTYKSFALTSMSDYEIYCNVCTEESCHIAPNC